MKNILMIDTGLPFELNTLYNEPLGGSESSFLLLSKGLAELNNSVIILNNLNYNVPQYDYNRILHNISIINEIIDQTDIIILNRVIIKELLDLNKPIFYYAHDAYDQNHILNWMFDKNILNKITKILCVSEWQKKSFNKYYNVPLDKMEVIYNSIDTSMGYGFLERDLNKLIFASIPYKGLEVLPSIFYDLILKSKNENLTLDIYSSFSLYKQEDNDETKKIFNELKKIKNINLFDPISNDKLIKEFMRSNLYIHPQTYHESFGINFIQSQLSGCLPITIDVGAAQEVIENKDHIINGKSLFHTETYNLFINKIIELLDMDLYKERLKAQQFSKKFNYLNIAKLVNNLF